MNNCSTIIALVEQLFICSFLKKAVIYMSEELREDIRKIGISAVLLAAVMLLDRFLNLPIWAALLLYLIPYLTVGFEVLKEAAENIAEGEFLDEDFLMCIATVGALVIGFIPGCEPQFAEAVFVMLFFRVGELFEEIAEGRSRKSISQLMNMRPDEANVERGGKVLTVDPQSVEVGEIVVVKPGEKIPMDGVIVSGESSLDTVALTGESLPRDVREGDDIISGCVNLSGLLRVRVTKSFGESTASKILDLVENASENKSKSENFITVFARYYTPAVVFSALALALLPPLFSGHFLASFGTWLGRALTFLVVSCPCALVVSVPLTFFGGIGGASRHGILIKGSNYMETLSRAGTVVFDKTGTLTKGVFEVSAIHPEKLDKNALLHLAAHVERYSTHPIAVSLRQAYGNEDDGCEITDVKEYSGSGIGAVVNGHKVYVGNDKMMAEIGLSAKSCHKTGTIVHVAVDGEYAGHIVISDAVKPDSSKAVRALKAAGVEKTVMLTGDREDVAKQVSAQLKLDEYHAELMPGDKVKYVEKLIDTTSAGKSLLFVGDGINDAPVLARADVGVAMGAMGSEAAIEAADVVLMDDKPSKIALAIRIAAKTIRIARENIIFAIAIKLAVLLLAAFGFAPMWLAVFADVGVMVLAVMNAARTLTE